MTILRDNVKSECDNLKTELNKEKSWWDKWMSDVGVEDIHNSLCSIQRDESKEKMRKFSTSNYPEFFEHLKKEYPKSRMSGLSLDLFLFNFNGSDPARLDFYWSITPVVSYLSKGESPKASEMDKVGKELLKLFIEYYKNK